MNFREEIQFIITGLNYQKLFPSNFSVGDVLDLEWDKFNSFDKDAIKILKNGRLVGYVPNKGDTCGKCFYPFGKKGWYCKYCGSSSEFIIPGGCATRIMSNNLLALPHHCWVSKITERNVVCTLLIDKEDGNQF